MLVDFLPLGMVADEKLDYAVIASCYYGKNLFVRHHERTTWEMPGGRREPGETIEETACRELVEETGAVSFDVVPVCEYSVTLNGCSTYGRLFFSRIEKLGELPAMEIAEVKHFEDTPGSWTYPLIQPELHLRVLTWLKGNQYVAI
jgi:8-oxo-dGTP diphosphatase